MAETIDGFDAAWALVIAGLALAVYVDRPKSPGRGNHLRRLRSSG